jgi:GntR family transcriptional regulator/MocR family aminotransferase
MAVEWSGLAPELLVRLDRSRRGALGSQLQAELREAIRSGRLAPGERLPSTRAMAAELEISRGLAQDCYEQLVAEGYLVARAGSATRVAEETRHAPAPPPPAPAAPVPSVDFRSGVPDIASFPMRDWMWAIGEAGRTAPLSAPGYGEPAGRPELRAVVAAYLRRVRGASVDPAHMVICGGFTQGLHLVLQALARAGHVRLGVEDPGHRDWAAIAERVGLRPVAVPVDADGARLGDVDAEVRAAVLTPAHQTPTGVVLTPARRREAIAWASERGGVLVEDDYDAEFRYDRQAVGSLQGLAPDLVVTIGSVSKSLAPALRLGWVVCPPALAEAVAHEKELADRGSPALDQLALARLIESGRYDRHLRRMRGVYARKREALVAALAEHAPQARLSGLAAGFHAVVRLPAGADEDTVAQAAAARGVAVYPLSGYRFADADHPPQLVLGFGNLTEAAIARGIAAIGDLLGGAREPVG